MLLESELMLSNGREKQNNKFGRKGKGTVFGQLDVLYQHFLGGTKETSE